MKALIVNLDKAVFRKHSANRWRLEEYSTLVEKLFAVVWTRKKEQPILKEKLDIYPTNSHTRLHYFFDTRRLVGEILLRERINLIISQDPFEVGLAAWLAARKHKIPLQLQIHADFLSPHFKRESLSNRLRVVLAKFLLSRADGVRVVSERIKKSFVASNFKLKTEPVVLPIFVDTEKIKKTPPSVDLHRLYPQFNQIILMVTRLSREKNVSLAISAMKKIVQIQPRAGLAIAGSGKQETNLKSLASSNGLKNNVVFLGRSEPERLISYYKSADIFLLTSNYEGWSLAAIEAMAAGCPVVMTDVGCAGEMVKNNQTGLVVPVGDEEAVVEAVLRMLTNKELVIKIKQRAWAAVGALKSQREYLQALRQSWEQAINNRNL